MSARLGRVDSGIAVVVVLLMVVLSLLAINTHRFYSITGIVDEPVSLENVIMEQPDCLEDSWEYKTSNGGCATKKITTYQQPDETPEKHEARHDERVARAMKKCEPKAQ